MGISLEAGNLIKSMTGFGQGEAANEHYKVSVEVKSVNHRYLDCSFACPGSTAGWKKACGRNPRQAVPGAGGS